jgi:hypothetical protein
MSREQIVEAYRNGDLDRREFIRRLVVAGVSLSAAMVYAQVIVRPAKAFAQPATDFYGGDLYGGGGGSQGQDHHHRKHKKHRRKHHDDQDEKGKKDKKDKKDKHGRTPR